jgi:acyl-CoA thioesterase II
MPVIALTPVRRYFPLTATCVAARLILSATETRMPSKKQATPVRKSAALTQLVGILDLEPIEVNLFRGQTQQAGWQRVYGGLVLAQALAAAIRTVDPDRHAHSMHGYFLLGGVPGQPIVYDVERIRDGASFNTRQVKAIQGGRAIFALSVSFQKEEVSFVHQAPMPQVPMPEDLPDQQALLQRFGDKLPENLRSYWQRDRPFELRPVDFARYVTRQPASPQQSIWVRASGEVGDDANLHRCLLAYVSDFTLLDTALIAHGKLAFDTDIQLASIDHAMWLHGPFRADDWLLYTQESSFAGGARGFCSGKLFTRDGKLVASVAQEGLVRQRPTAFVLK